MRAPEKEWNLVSLAASRDVSFFQFNQTMSTEPHLDNGIPLQRTIVSIRSISSFTSPRPQSPSPYEMEDQQPTSPPSQQPSPPLPSTGNPLRPKTPLKSPPSAPPNYPSRVSHKIPRKKSASGGYWTWLPNAESAIA